MTRETEFWKLVDKTDKCWLWKGPRFGPEGYGLFKGDKPILAHRAALLFSSGGEVLPKTPAIWSCKNHGCVNPDHLSFDQ